MVMFLLALTGEPAGEWSMNGDPPMITCNSVVSRAVKRILNVAAVLSILALGGCVDSAEPFLKNPEPILGQKLRVHVIPVGKEQTDPFGEIFAYAWNGARYEPVSKSKGTQQPFTVHHFGAQDYIVQGFPTSDTVVDTVTYALVQKAAEGVYVMSWIEEKDLDEETRAKLCDPGFVYSCRISSAEALAQMARATARAQRQPLHVLLLRGEDEQAPN
jgi:hypothetical protein